MLQKRAHSFRGTHRVGAAVVIVAMASACGGVTDGEAAFDQAVVADDDVGQTSQAVVWTLSSGLMHEHHAWHTGGRAPTNQGTDFLAFHRTFLAKLATEYRAQGRPPADMKPWTFIPSALKTSALGWNSTLAAAETRILTNNPPFANENEFGTHMESTIHNWIHGAAAAHFGEPVLGTFDSPSSTYFFQIHGMIERYWSRFIGRRALHVASTTNTSGNSTDINHPMLNGRPFARLLVTQNWRTSGPYNNSNVGVWFNTSTGRWAIFNENLSPIPVGAAFNLQIEGGVFTQAAYSANTSGQSMTVHHPLSDGAGAGAARVSSTHNWSPLGAPTGPYNNHPTGVWFTGSNWAVFNQDIASISGTSFNLLAAAPLNSGVTGSHFVHTATTANTTGHTTVLSHADLNGNSSALVIVTPNWNPSGAAGVYNNNPIGVWFSASSGRWNIFNQNLVALPANAAFNVVVMR